MPTESTENYLKTIFLLEEESTDKEQLITTNQIAQYLGFTRASVSGRLQSMADEGFIIYEKYKGVRLTEKGRLGALAVLRKHRLIEMLLVELFQYQWDEVHEEAELLEHSVSDRLAQRIDEFLGFPPFDPHGDPIPTCEGVMPVRQLFPLSKLSVGASARLGRVMTNDKEFLQYLQTQNIDIGVSIEMLRILDMNGMVEVRVADAEPITLTPLVVSKPFMLFP